MKLLRFNRTERLFHWSFAIPMLLLAVSGVMMVGTSFGIVLYSKETLRFFHTRTGFVLITLPIMVCLQGDRQVISRNFKDFFNFTGSDRRWLVLNFISLIKSEVELPPEHKFNGGQKVNAMMMMGLSLTLCLSGLTMLVIKGALVANIFHVFAFAIFAFLLPGHLYLAMINPATRPALMGIIKGYVDAEWMRHHHILMFRGLQDTIFDGVTVSHAKKKELPMIYKNVYKDKISRKDFHRLCGLSEAMLIARKNMTPIAFMQIVGDGCLHGYITRLLTLSEMADEDIFLAKFTLAAEAITGHSLTHIKRQGLL